MSISHGSLFNTSDRRILDQMQYLWILGYVHTIRAFALSRIPDNASLHTQEWWFRLDFLERSCARGEGEGILDYSTNIWVEVSRWGFETLTLFRKKNSFNTYPVWEKPSILLPCLGQRTKFTPSSFKAIYCVSILGNKIHLANQINRAGNTLLTDSLKVIYPV